LVPFPGCFCGDEDKNGKTDKRVAFIGKMKNTYRLWLDNLKVREILASVRG